MNKAPKQRRAESIADEARLRRRGLPVYVGAAAIVVAALVVYWPSLDGGFIMDDDLCLTASPLIQAPDGLYRFWFTTEPVDYWPVSNSTLWVEWRLWEMNPTGYRATNIVMHVASSLLLWMILTKLAIPGAWLAAILFAVHPVNVESVAWISQRKEVLAVLLMLVAVLWYLKSEEIGRDWGWYLASLVAFVLAMLSKGSVAMLPLLLLIVVWWRSGRVGWRDLLRLIPFFVVSAILAVVNVWFQTHGSDQTIRDVTPLERLLGAGAAVWFYLYTALAPIDLTFVYPQWNVDASELRWWIPLLGAVVVTALLMWRRDTRFGRPLLFGWLLFCLALVPALGFADVGFMKYTLVANRYQHIAMIAVVTLVAAGWTVLYRAASIAMRRVSLAVAAIAVAALMMLARRESELFGNPIALYETTIRNNPESSLANYNLGLKLFEAGRREEAVNRYREALRLKPDHLEAHNNLGIALKQLDRPDEAIEQYREVLRRSPGHLKAHLNLGIALKEAGRPQEAIKQYQAALRYMPDAAQIHSNLAVLLATVGRHQEALAHFRDAVRLEPGMPQWRYNLGHALRQAGQLQAALEQFEALARQEPDVPELYLPLATTLVELERLADAIATAERGLAIAQNTGNTAAAEALRRWLNDHHDSPHR